MFANLILQNLEALNSLKIVLTHLVYFKFFAAK